MYGPIYTKFFGSLSFLFCFFVFVSLSLLVCTVPSGFGLRKSKEGMLFFPIERIDYTFREKKVFMFLPWLIADIFPVGLFHIVSTRMTFHHLDLQCDPFRWYCLRARLVWQWIFFTFIIAYFVLVLVAVSLSFDRFSCPSDRFLQVPFYKRYTRYYW